MQLRLIRFYLLILLLVSLFHVEALEKLSRFAEPTPGPTAMPFQQVSSSFWANDEKVLESPRIHELVAQVDPESRETQRRQNMQRRSGGRTASRTITSSPSHSTVLLAEKFAQDALQSREMQDTIKELTSLNSDRIEHQKMSNKAEKVFDPTETSSSEEHPAKTTVKRKDHGKHKGQGNRKHDKHRKQSRKHRPPKRRLKRHHSMKESSKTAREWKSRNSMNRERRRGHKGKSSSEKLVTCRRKRSDQTVKRRKIIDQTSRENLEPYINGDQDSIDELPNFESTQRKYRGIPISMHGEREGNAGNRKRSHMLAQLMLTTTRDPNKEKPGDQGVEYSEYYNDNEDILVPDIKSQSKLDDVAKTVMGGQIRSVRNTADENFLDQHYHDSSNEQPLEEDVERSKRNDQKLLRVMEEPSNSMEYVDNTYGPAQASGVGYNEKIPQYPINYNYIPDQHNVPGNPSVEVVRPRQPTSNRIYSDPHAIFDQNPAIIKNLPIKAPSNMIPSNLITSNARSVVPGRSGLRGNVALSQLPQPRLAGGDLPHYSVNEMSAEQSTSSLTRPVAFPISTSPGKPVQDLGANKLSTLYAATSVVTSSSLSGLNPTLPYDSSERNGRIIGSATPASGTSVAPISPNASLVTFKVTSSPGDISSAFLDSSKISSTIRDVSPELGAPKVENPNENNAAESTQCPAQMGSTASRNTAAETMAVEKEKKKDSNLTRTDVQIATTVSKMNAEEKNGLSKAAKEIDVSPTASSQASSITRSSASEAANSTLLANETKVVANKILNEIIDELEQMRLETPKDEQKEGLPCKLTGSWVTARAGVRVDMNVTNHSVQVALDHLTPPITTDGLLNVTWNVTGFAPFKRGGPFTLLATNNHTKTLAVFVGACKVCQGIDTIEGSWTVSREPRDCRDFQMSTSVYNEIFRRTRLYSAIKDKKSKLETPASSTMATTASGNSSPSEGTSTIHEVSDHLGKSKNQSLEFIGME